MDKTLVRGAMLIALTVVLQSLRLFIPLPPMASMFFIGTLVNMMLAVTVRLAGLKPALLAVVLLPFFAYLQGQLPIPLLIPVVIGGNAVFVLICHWAWHRGLMLAPLAKTKTICMFTSSLVLLKVLALPEKMVFAIGFMMGWPQMVTGICGILLARLITKRTANF